MRILKLCVGALLLMALVTVGFARADVDNAGTAAASFLSLGSGARTLAMGGATLGLGDDVSGSAWNVAALGWANESELAFSHAGMKNETSQEWAAFGGRFGRSQTRWALSGLYQGNGSFEGRDASNNPTGSFSVSSLAIGAHLAQQLGGALTVGIGAKSVMEKLGDVSGSGFTFDGGVMFRQGMVGLGVAAQNVFGQMKYGNAIYGFPSSYGVGLGIDHARSGFHLAVDLNLPNTYASDVRTGVEWTFKDMVALRSGYRMELGSNEDQLSGPSFGMGAGYSGFWFDYGYLVEGSAGGGEHRLGFTYRPGQSDMNRTIAQAGASAEEPKPAAKVKPRTSTAENKKSKTKAQAKAKPSEVALAEESTKSTDQVKVLEVKPGQAPKDAVKPPVAEPAPVTAPPKREPEVQPVPWTLPEPAKAVAKPIPTPVTPPAPKPVVKAEPVAPPVSAKVQAPSIAKTPEKETAKPVSASVVPPPTPKPVAKAEPVAPAVTTKSPEKVPAPVVAPTKSPEKVPAPMVAPTKSPEKVPATAVAPAKAPEKETVPEAAPSKKRDKKAAASAPAKAPRPQSVKVKSGETMAQIAQRHGVSVAAIMMENNLVTDRVKPGQTLKLPREK